MSEHSYLFFLGCLIPYRLSSYEISARKVLKKLEINLVEMPDFNCCGFPIKPVDFNLSLSLAARDLCIAEKLELDILTLCNGCFSTLNEANKILKEKREVREEINSKLQQIKHQFKGTRSVKHLVHVLTQDIGLEKIKKHISNPLTMLKVAQHSGCHLLRPADHIEYNDDPENPKMLKDLIKLTGAECLDYFDETECCGNTIIGVNEKIPFQMARDKLDHVKSVGAQALITVCPSCHMMYDFNQPRMERFFNTKFKIPIIHYTQLLGLAMGFPPKDLELNQLIVKPADILNKIKKAT